MPTFRSPADPPPSLIRPTPRWIAVAAACAMAALGGSVRVALGERIGDHGAFLVFVPAVVLFLTIFSVIIIGEWLRTRSDPASKL
jgi:ABC-type dipeptide/oligopeptide/nickel transport system permease subunit